MRRARHLISLSLTQQLHLKGLFILCRCAFPCLFKQDRSACAPPPTLPLPLLPFHVFTFPYPCLFSTTWTFPSLAPALCWSPVLTSAWPSPLPLLFSHLGVLYLQSISTLPFTRLHVYKCRLEHEELFPHCTIKILMCWFSTCQQNKTNQINSGLQITVCFARKWL